MIYTTELGAIGFIKLSHRGSLPCFSLERDSFFGWTTLGGYVGLKKIYSEQVTEVCLCWR